MIYPMLIGKNDTPLMASDAPATQTSVPQVILGNGNRRFSGVTSTLLQVLPHQMESMEIAVLGSAHMPSSVRTLSFLSASSFAPRRYGPKASGVSCSAEYRDGPGAPSQMLGR